MLAEKWNVMHNDPQKTLWNKETRFGGATVRNILMAAIKLQVYINLHTYTCSDY